MNKSKKIHVLFNCLIFYFFIMCVLSNNKVYALGISGKLYRKDLTAVKIIKSDVSIIEETSKNALSVNINHIELIPDIYLNIYKGERNFLPTTVRVRFTDGKTRDVKVKWNVDTVFTNNPGKYYLEGRLVDYENSVNCYINVEDTAKLIEKLVILPEGSYNKEEGNKIIKRISNIYPGILKRFLDKGICIKLTNTPVTELPELEYLRGIVPRGWQSTGKTWDDVPGVSGNPIVIRIGYSEPGMGHSSANLELHETAHTVDSYLLSSISATKEFKEIWKKEVKSLFGQNSYYNSYPDEYFAEAFAMFYLDGEYKYELSYKAPLTFNFIENIEDRIDRKSVV